MKFPLLDAQLPGATIAFLHGRQPVGRKDDSLGVAFFRVAPACRRLFRLSRKGGDSLRSSGGHFRSEFFKPLVVGYF